MSKTLHHVNWLLCACLVALVSPQWSMADEATPLETIQILIGNYRKGPDAGVIGHLGGQPVSIPAEFAHFVEYDGDPGFLEKRKEKRPERSFKSGISSFGFDIHYPDMTPENKQNRTQKRKESVFTSTWMNVGVLSNSSYQDRSPAKMAELAQAWLKFASVSYHYEEQVEKRYGLTVYEPTNADPSGRELGSTINNPNDLNIYVHPLENGGADAYIECSNMNHAAAPCQHLFGLEPELKADVTLIYRKGLLPHWREIQDGVTKILLGFRVDPSSGSIPSSENAKKWSD